MITRLAIGLDRGNVQYFSIYDHLSLVCYIAYIVSNPDTRSIAGMWSGYSLAEWFVLLVRYVVCSEENSS